jgi:hypothetical protein
LDLRAQIVKKKISICESDAPIVVEVGAAKRGGKRETGGQVVVDPIEAVRHTHRDRRGIRCNGINTLRVRRKSTADSGRARRRENGTLKKIDVALGEVGFVARGARFARR